MENLQQLQQNSARKQISFQSNMMNKFLCELFRKYSDLIAHQISWRLSPSTFDIAAHVEIQTDDNTRMFEQNTWSVLSIIASPSKCTESQNQSQIFQCSRVALLPGNIRWTGH